MWNPVSLFEILELCQGRKIEYEYFVPYDSKFKDTYGISGTVYELDNGDMFLTSSDQICEILQPVRYYVRSRPGIKVM